MNEKVCSLNAKESLIKIDEWLWQFPAVESPLSADIGIVEGKSGLWFYDCGSSDDAFELIDSADCQKHCVISHFHQDHTENLKRLKFEKVYGGNYTCTHFPECISVTSPLVLEDGFRIELIPVPSSHSKGSLAMNVDCRYAFLGDSFYCTVKDRKAVFNVQLLGEQLEVLEKMETRYFLLSHEKQFVREKGDVLEALKTVYSKRRPHSPWIEITESLF